MRTGSTISASSVVDPAEWIERNEREHPHRLFLRTPTGRGLSYQTLRDRKSTRLNSSHQIISYAVFCLKKKKKKHTKQLSKTNTNTINTPVVTICCSR